MNVLAAAGGLFGRQQGGMLRGEARGAVGGHRQVWVLVVVSWVECFTLGSQTPKESTSISKDLNRPSDTNLVNYCNFL